MMGTSHLLSSIHRWLPPKSPNALIKKDDWVKGSKGTVRNQTDLPGEEAKSFKTSLSQNWHSAFCCGKQPSACGSASRGFSRRDKLYQQLHICRFRPSLRWHRRHNGGLTLTQGSVTTHQLKNRTWSNGRFLTSIKTAGIEDPLKTTRQKPRCGLWGTFIYLKWWQIVFSCLETKIFPARQKAGNKQKREVLFCYQPLLLHFTSPLLSPSVQLAVTPISGFLFLLFWM